ncbi:MAG: efflux RND transporter periplasmic adaptor subunit, partial [Gammaproteobacteria bacterium]|nr:efflux RND transporter periplasmic adaptor subunit [Gammaproteobacteria bacterium]
ALPAGSGLAPGQQLTVTLNLPAPADARAVPRAAVSRVAEQAYVFVARDTRFLWTPVEVLGESGAHSVIRGPLEQGERVVVSGIAALKAQLAD